MNNNYKVRGLSLLFLSMLTVSMLIVNAESKENKESKDQNKIVTITGLVFIADENEIGETSAVGIMVEKKTDVEKYYVENNTKGIELLEQALNMVTVTGTVYKNKKGEMWIKVTSWELVEYEDTEGEEKESEPVNEE
jgi:hypothetical protein